MERTFDPSEFGFEPYGETEWLAFHCPITGKNYDKAVLVQLPGTDEWTVTQSYNRKEPDAPDGIFSLRYSWRGRITSPAHAKLIFEAMGIISHEPC